MEDRGSPRDVKFPGFLSVFTEKRKFKIYVKKFHINFNVLFRKICYTS